MMSAARQTRGRRPAAVAKQQRGDHRQRRGRQHDARRAETIEQRNQQQAAEAAPIRSAA